MTDPVDDQCTPQPREQAVACWCGRTTWNLSALCHQHDPQISESPADSDGHRHPPAGRPRPAPVPPPVQGKNTGAPHAPAGGHATASVPTTSSTPPPASTPGPADAPAAARDHSPPRTAGCSERTATFGAAGGIPLCCT